MERTEPWVRAPQLPSTEHIQSLGLTCSYLPASLLPGWCPLMWPGPLPSSLPRGLTPQTPLLSWCPHPSSLLTVMSQQWTLCCSLYCLKKCFPWAYFSFHQSSPFPSSVGFLKIVYQGSTLEGSPSGQGHVGWAQQGAGAGPEFMLTKGHLFWQEMYRQGAKGWCPPQWGLLTQWLWFPLLHKDS